MTDAIARLTVAPGDGYLARRPSSVLYASSVGVGLVDVFNDADEAEVIDVVTDFAEANSFDDGPFVIVSWASQWRVALFGEIELVSDQASLSRLSGASSSTWIERQLRTKTAMTVGVSMTEADTHTDLTAGVVRASGFALSLTPSDQTAVTPTEATPLHRVETPVSAAATPAAPSLAEVPGASDTSLENLVVQRAARDDETIDVPDELVANATHSVAGQKWQLRFVDGPVEQVDTTLVLGRKPHRGDDEAARLLTFDCKLMSASHLRVEVDPDGYLVVTDLGSSNGTWMVTSGDGQPVQIPPHQPTRLETGTPVQIGSQVFFVEHE